MGKKWNPDIEIIEGDRYRYHLWQAYHYAWEHSEDPVTKTGAVIVDPDLDVVLAYGTNHFPKGLDPTKEQLLDRDWRLKHIIHAEPANIFNAARKGVSTKGKMMCMPWVPCTPCAISIIDSGIETLIGHKELIMKTPERWWESTDYALGLLKKAGVKCYMYEGKIGFDVLNLFNGEPWEP